MLPRKILPILAGSAAVIAVAVPVATAAPVPQITTKYTYKVELKGVQTTKWSLNHVGSGSCDSNQSGTGKQTVRFTGRPTKIHMFDAISPTFFTVGRTGEAAGTLSFKLRGNVTRSGSIQTAPLSPAEAENCPDGVGGPVLAPDCGTRKLKKLVVTPEYAFGSDRIILEQGDTDDSYFQRCPHLGGGWPYLLNEDDAGKTVGQDLPVQELFDNGKTIIIARGTKTETGEVTSTTKIRWELSFTRVAKEKLSGK